MTKAMIWTLAALAAALGGIALTVREPPAPVLRAGVALETPTTLRHFELIDQDGAPFTRASLRGRWTLIVPGFTRCPDICPTTLATLNRVHQGLGDDAHRVGVVLLSLDPARDTPEVLADYVGYFNPEFAAVTGAAEQLEALYLDLGINHIRIPGAKGEYSVDHSTALLLIDPKGRLAGYVVPPINAGLLTADLAQLLAPGD